MSHNLATAAHPVAQPPVMPQSHEPRLLSLQAHMSHRGVSPTNQRIAHAALPALLRGRSDTHIPAGVAAVILGVVEQVWYRASEQGRQDADARAVREYDALPVDLQARWPALMTGANYTALRDLQQEYRLAMATDTPLAPLNPSHPPELIPTSTSRSIVSSSQFLRAPGHVVRFHQRADGGCVAHLHGRDTGRSCATTVHATLADCHAEVLAELLAAQSA